MKNVNMPVGKYAVPKQDSDVKAPARPNLLFDLNQDPEQNDDLAGSGDEQHYVDLLTEALSAVDSPPEQFERMGLSQP